MKYYNKEWFELMQKQDYTSGLTIIPDKDYTDPSTGERLIHNDNLVAGKMEEQDSLEHMPVFTAEKIGNLTDLIYYMISQMCQKENYVLKLGISEHNKVHLWKKKKKNRELKRKLKETKLISPFMIIHLIKKLNH